MIATATRVALPRPPRRWLAPTAIVVVFGLFGPFYLLGLLGLAWQHGIKIPPSGAPTWASMALFTLDFYPNLLFADLGRYLAASAAGIVFSIAALTLRRPRPVTAILLVLGLVAILAFPWYYRYRPALTPAPGHTMLVATQAGLLDGVVKRAQLGAELLPCRYQLLGWSGAGELYYQSTCDADSRLWAVAPDPEATPRAVTEAPIGLVAEESQSAVVGAVRHVGSDPLYESNLRLAAIRGKVGMPSPDGRWVALVSRHIYGPEDVLIVSR